MGVRRIDGGADGGQGGLPCDLPLEDRYDDGERLSTSRVRRIAALTILLIVAVTVIVLVCARGCSGTGPGSVARAAGDGASQMMAAARLAGENVQERARRGEGIVLGTVCIDAGHGGGADLTLTPIGPGSDQMQYVEPGGTSGVVTGREEAVVTLEIAKLLRDKLEDLGVAVVMVREDNDTAMSSEQRAVIANEAGADLFVRLHCDGSVDPTANGFSTLIPGYNQWTADIVEQSAFAASIMHPIVVAESGANDAGIVERYDLAGFNFCDVPSLLFEMGFMSNPEEDVKLSDPAYQETMAQAICDATVAYLEAVSG